MGKPSCLPCSVPLPPVLWIACIPASSSPALKPLPFLLYLGLPLLLSLDHEQPKQPPSFLGQRSSGCTLSHSPPTPHPNGEWEHNGSCKITSKHLTGHNQEVPLLTESCLGISHGIPPSSSLFFKKERYSKWLEVSRIFTVKCGKIKTQGGKKDLRPEITRIWTRTLKKKRGERQSKRRMQSVNAYFQRSTLQRHLLRTLLHLPVRQWVYLGLLLNAYLPFPHIQPWFPHL